MALFPGFAAEWDEGKAFGYEHGEFTHHSVMLTFGPVSHRLLCDADVEAIQRFCALLNTAVEHGDVLENAVSTCFLEHASQLGVRGLIEPYLSKAAIQELR